MILKLSDIDAMGAAKKSGVNVAFRLVAELRPAQWIKNLTCFAGVVFSGQLFEAVALWRSFAGFVAFCCASSCVYILNDLLDREADRRNPRTRHRPIASGDISVRLAAMTGLLLLLVAVTVSGWLGMPCAVVIGAYLLLNVCYSLRLKHAIIADVMCIALGFVFRVVFGVYAVQVQPTAWIVMCMFFLAVFLGFAKRKSERESAADDLEAIRPVHTKYTGVYLDILLAMTATMTIITYGMFTVASIRNPTLVVTVVPVAYCIMRYMHQVINYGRGESPESLLLYDKMLWIGISVWLVLCVVILYGDIQVFTEVASSSETLDTSTRIEPIKQFAASYKTTP